MGACCSDQRVGASLNTHHLSKLRDTQKSEGDLTTLGTLKKAGQSADFTTVIIHLNAPDHCEFSFQHPWLDQPTSIGSVAAWFLWSMLREQTEAQRWKMKTLLLSSDWVARLLEGIKNNTWFDIKEASCIALWELLESTITSEEFTEAIIESHGLDILGKQFNSVNEHVRNICALICKRMFTNRPAIKTQFAKAYCLQQMCHALPKFTDPHYIHDNLRHFEDFILDQVDWIEPENVLALKDAGMKEKLANVKANIIALNSDDQKQKIEAVLERLTDYFT